MGPVDSGRESIWDTARCATAQVVPARETGPLYTLVSGTRAAALQYPQMLQVRVLN